MPLRETQDATALLRIAQDWFRTSPDEPMPAEAWIAMAESMVNPGRLNVQENGFAPVFETPALIPAFAAITLGASIPQLAKILMHHGVTAGMFAQIVCMNMNPNKEVRVDSNMMSSWNISYQFMQAVTFDRAYGLKFAEELRQIPVDPDTQVACLLTEFPELWPVTHIHEYIRQVDCGDISVSDSPPEMTPAHSLRYVQTNLDRFSDEQRLQILERSGNLCLGATKEYGFKNGFFKSYLNYLSDPKRTNITMLRDSINKIEDPSLIERIKLRMYEDLANSDFSYTTDGAHIHEVLAGENPALSSVTDSTTLMLNILPLQQAINYEEMRSHYYLEMAKHAFYDGRHTVLQDLQAEIMAIEPKNLKSEHFRALNQLFVEWKHQQNLHGVDLKALMSHVLKGWDAYQERQNDPGNGFVANHHDVIAGEHLAGFIQFVCANTEHDYSDFADMSSPVKANLVKNGYDIKKLPGIANRDRGHLLESVLGL
jgi:hypothetical protein